MLDKMHTAYEKTLANLKQQRAKAFYAKDREGVDNLDNMIAKTKANIDKLEKQMWGEEEWITVSGLGKIQLLQFYLQPQ